MEMRNFRLILSFVELTTERLSLSDVASGSSKMIWMSVTTIDPPDFTPAMLSFRPVSANWKVRVPLALLLFFSLPLFGEAQTQPPLASVLPVEAQTSVFSSADGKGELSAQGSWQMSFLSSVSLFRPAGGGLQLGQVQPLLMTQTPDLLLNFNLFDRWYVEARVSPDPGATRYAAGYRGAKGEAFQELRIGNSKIGFPDLPFVSLGEGGAYSFGALLRAGGPSFDARALLRYDQADRVHRIFAGSREIAESTQAAGDFVRGRWFLLPGVESGLRIFVQSAAGALTASDGTKWRQLGIEEYSLEHGGSVVALGAAATTRVAVAWTGLGLASFSASNSSLSIVIDSSQCALAFDPAAAPFTYDPASPLPVEILSHYALPPGSSDLFVRDRASGKKLSQYVAISKIDGSAEVRSSDGLSVAPRPFLADEPSLYSHVPGATTTVFPDLDEFEIVGQSFSATDGIPLDVDTIDSSIEVLRDGIPDTAFEIDRTKNLLILLRPPAVTERIDLSYLKESAQRKSGALSAGIIGRYSKDDVSAWGAMTGHLGIPGQGYADAGQDSPAWAQLALGSAKSEGFLTWQAGLAGRLGYAESSGRYRIDGMEDAGTASSSWWPSGGSSFASVTCTQVAAPSFDAAWPQLSAILHTQSEASDCLEIAASSSLSSATVSPSYLRIVDPPPLSSFGTFTFFVLGTVGASGSLSTATVSITIDDGLAGHEALSLTLPLSEFTSGWTRVRYHFATGKITLTVGESGAESTFFSATAPRRDSQVTAASRITISLSGLGPGDRVDIDELLLEDPVGSASLDAVGNLRYKDDHFKILAGNITLLEGMDASLNLSGGLADQSWGYGDFGIKSKFGPFGIDAGIGLEGSGSAITGYGRHTLSFMPSWSPLQASDRFIPAIGGNGYDRRDSLGLKLGPLGSISAEAASIYSDDPQSSDPGLLQRTWKLALGDGAVVSANASALESSSDSGRLTGSSTYFDRWYSSFSDYAPSAMGALTRRAIDSEVDLLPMIGSPLLSAKLSFDGSGQGLGDKGSSLVLRTGGSIRLPGDTRLTSWYARSWTARTAGIDSDLLSFGMVGIDGISGLGLPWTSIPIVEFQSPDLARGFSKLALGGTYSSASYIPEIGLKFEREPGISPWELLIPAMVSGSYSRKLTSDGFTVLDTGEIDSAIVFSALELFGANGSLPLFTRYADDEYRLGLSSIIDLPSAAPINTWSLAQDGMASLFGKGSIRADRLVVSERFALNGTPSGTTWNLNGGLDLGQGVEKTWLLALFDFVTLGSSKAIGSLPAGLESQWLSSIAGSRPRARRTASFDFSLATTSGDKPSAFPTLSFDESLESRISIPDRLDVFSKLKLTQSLDATGYLLLGFEASAGLTLSF